MKKTLITVAAVAVVLGSVYGFYQLKRWFNYEMGYSSMVTKEVKQQICSLIKSEKHAEIFVNPSMCK